MRVGLLVCDHVRDRHVGIAGDYDDHFRALFSGHPEVDLVVYDVVGGVMPSAPSECDAWITTGSRHSVNEDLQWIRDLEAFVREVARAGVPFVGICFGHQVLAKALGGSVVKSDRGWGVGIQNVEMAEGSFDVMNMHQDQVDQLPTGAEVLGWNQHCPVSVMSVGSTMLGIQGHPEMPKGYIRTLLEERRGELIPEETADLGLESLGREADSVLLADWIVDFASHPDGRKSRS